LLIDNRAGASGTIGSEMMVKAPPDGYTLLLITTTHTINPSLIKLPFDPLKDFAPVSLILSQPNILVVHPSVTVKSVKELVALARAKPGSLSYAFGGSGSSPHLSGELFKLVAGIDLVHIPHRCSRPGCGSSRTARRQAQALPTGCAAAARGQSTLPGFMMPFGSSTCLSLRITSSSTALL
jgi:tripartite-type tricarboxylate transporter receptor subunit TctC